jgi:post-segregation antitoxin (ccd killing protein)
LASLNYSYCITDNDYTMTEMLTFRIDKETKRKIKRYGIHVSQVARAAILREIERKEREEALQALRRTREILRKVDTKRVVEHVREDRSAR